MDKQLFNKIKKGEDSVLIIPYLKLLVVSKLWTKFLNKIEHGIRFGTVHSFLFWLLFVVCFSWTFYYVVSDSTERIYKDLLRLTVVTFNLDSQTRLQTDSNQENSSIMKVTKQNLLNFTLEDLRMNKL